MPLPKYGPPLTTPAEEMSRHFSRWADAAQEAPVIVTRHKRARAVIIAPDRYEAWAARDEAVVSEGEQRFEASLAMVLDHTSEGFFACDDDLCLLSANAVFETLIGKPESQLWGLDIAYVFGPAQGSIVREHLAAVRTAREVAEVELRDDDRNLLIRAFPYPTGVAALILNRSRELDLRQRWARHQAVDRALAAMPNIGRVELNLRGVIQRADDAFESMVGFTLKELNRFRLSEIVQPKVRAEFNGAFEAALSGGPALVRTTLLAKGGGVVECDLAVSLARRDGIAEAIMVVATCDNSLGRGPG